ncbi:MAG: hypothetical protein ABIX46_04900 [Burkholderiaceae bacterium]
MSIPAFRSRITRRCAFVLWLALLLPAVQSLAAWHAQSHARIDVEVGVDDPRLAHLQACDLCLTLAGLAHTAPPPVPLVAAPLRLAQAPPAPWPDLPDGAAAVFAYQGRAPPDAPR